MTWSRIARRIRVPLGFAFAAVFLWLARPTPLFLASSLILVMPGLWLRGYASGYVKKNTELTTTGPYAHTRNPLYLGSILIGLGFAVASRSVWVFVALVALFGAIYWPVIRSEEAYLRSVFPAFEAYAVRVPRLIPRIVRGAEPALGQGKFSWTLYLKHREYNAAMGAAGMYAALILKLVFVRW
ncbi:MAG: isoprenylcysteine carboxylmethyltransferase family protein [Acidobacteriaceae bacterium]